jgi:hypothetical protein
MINCCDICSGATKVAVQELHHLRVAAAQPAVQLPALLMSHNQLLSKICFHSGSYFVWCTPLSRIADSGRFARVALVLREGCHADVSAVERACWLLLGDKLP